MNQKMLLLITSVVVLFISSCSKQEATDPNRTRTKLTIELFDSIETADHKIALNKISRLRQLDKENHYLAKLEQIMLFNQAILKVQNELDKNNLPKAISLIEDEIKKYGQEKMLVQTYNELKKLREIHLLVYRINNPKSAFDLAKNTLRLKKLCKTYDKANPLNTVIDQKIEEAKQLHELEKKRAKYYLEETAAELDSKSDPVAPLLLAHLEVISTNSDNKPQKVTK